MDVRRSGHPGRRAGLAPAGRAGRRTGSRSSCSGWRYDLVRGQADNNRHDPHHRARRGRRSSCSSARCPTTSCRTASTCPSEIQWWEAITGVTYMTHFFVVYLTAAVLFLRSKERFIRWMTALVLLTVLGLLGYWLYPMAPPWMAADRLQPHPGPGPPRHPGPAPAPPHLRRPALDPRQEQQRDGEPGGGHAVAARRLLDAVHLVLLQAGDPVVGQGAAGRSIRC